MKHVFEVHQDETGTWVASWHDAFGIVATQSETREGLIAQARDALATHYAVVAQHTTIELVDSQF